MKKRFLAIFIVVLMLFSQITVFASDIDSNSTSINPEDKISEELKEVMNNTADDEYIPIVVWLNDYGDDIVYTNLSNEYGITLNAYNETIYIQNRINEAIDLLEEKYQINNDLKNDIVSLKELFDINELKENNISNYITEYEKDMLTTSDVSIEKIITISEENRYINEWRQTRKEINEYINALFISKLDKSNCKNIEANTLLTCVSLECKKAYIYSIASTIEVTKVGMSIVNYDSFPLELDAEEQETAEEVNEQHMLTMDTLGYDGTGVRVGVVEVRGSNDGTCVLLNTNNVHLYQKFLDGSIQENYEFCGVTNNRTIDDHATQVVSILCGKEVNGYKGIAPDASIYFAPCNGMPSYSTPTVGTLYDALDWLINDCDVSVINMSFGNAYSDRYSFLDNYMDCLIAQYRVTIVVAAGNRNDGRILSPGAAANAITVGNLTKNKINGKYTIHSTSSNVESIYMSNKPDVVAFGTNVHMYETNYTDWTTTTEVDNFGSGTSFSTPQVSGLVALLIEANPDLIRKPETIKSILTVNAKHNVYTSLASVSPQPKVYNGTTYTRNLTSGAGAGLIDIVASIQAALRDDFQRFYLSNSKTSVITNRYYLYEGNSIEFSMCFEKTNHSLLKDAPNKIDINVQIIDYYNNQVVFDSLHYNHNEASENYCSSGVNNVENYSVTVNSTGVYVFKIYVMSGTFDDVTNVEIPEVHETDHNGTYVSLSVSCGCTDKNIQTTSTQSFLYEHYCNNCKAQFEENYSYDVETTNITYNGSHCGYVEYIVKFRMTMTGVELKNQYSCQFIKDSNSLYDVHIVIDGGDFQYTSTGYRQSYTYMFIIVDAETETQVGTMYDTITIVYDNRIEYSAYLVN